MAQKKPVNKLTKKNAKTPAIQPDKKTKSTGAKAPKDSKIEPAVVNLGGTSKEVSKKALNDLKYSDYYKNYLANKKGDGLITKIKEKAIMKKSLKPGALGVGKIPNEKVFQNTAPISYTREVSPNGYNRYFNKPGAATINAIPTVAANMPTAPVNPPVEVINQPSQVYNYPQPPQPINNAFYANPRFVPPGFQHPNGPQPQYQPRQVPPNYYGQPRPQFNNPSTPNYQFPPNPYANLVNPNNVFGNGAPTSLVPSFDVPPGDIETRQLLAYNPLEWDLSPTNNQPQFNRNALVVNGNENVQAQTAALMGQMTRILDVCQRQMATQQIIIEKQQVQVERQQEMIERLQTKLIEQHDSALHPMLPSDEPTIEPTDFLDTQEHEFHDYLQPEYKDLAPTQKVAPQRQYEQFVELSKTQKVDQPQVVQAVVSEPVVEKYVTDTLEYVTDEVSDEPEAEITDELVEYTDFNDEDDGLVDENLLTTIPVATKETASDEIVIKTTPTGEIEEVVIEGIDDEYTDLVTDELSDSLSAFESSNEENPPIIATAELEEVDADEEPTDEYTDLVTEEFPTADLNQAPIKSDLIATSIIENLTEPVPETQPVTENLKKKVFDDKTATKLSPSKRFWEPLVGDSDYGYYNNKSWN